MLTNARNTSNNNSYQRFNVHLSIVRKNNFFFKSINAQITDFTTSIPNDSDIKAHKSNFIYILQ